MSARKDDERVNRNPLTHNVGNLEWDGERRGPELPDGFEWCDRTIEFWETWRTSPQAMLFTDTDWEEMLTTARLHNYVWGMHMVVDKITGGFVYTDCDPKEAKSLSDSIRIRLEKVGATVKDRASLGMKIQTSGADVVKTAEQVASQAAVDYRRNLGGKGS